jgi:hypothetical protein
MKRELINTKNMPSKLSEMGEKYLISQFMDDFAISDEKEEMISIEPIFDDENYRISCEVAALIKMLAQNENMTIPEWTYDKKYIYDKPYFGIATMKEYQDYLYRTTPEPFRTHNIFLGDRAFTRR